MSTITASALTVAALAPAVALAAGVDLRGAPSLRLVDANHATLSFTTGDRLTRGADGTYRVRIAFAGPTRKVTSIAADGRHRDDYRYSAKVSSTSARASARSTRSASTARSGS